MEFADIAEILETISSMSGAELEQVQEALERRREKLAQSTVIERRGYDNGILGTALITIGDAVRGRSDCRADLSGP